LPAKYNKTCFASRGLYFFYVIVYRCYQRFNFRVAGIQLSLSMLFIILILVAAAVVFVVAWHRSANRPTHAGGIVFKKEKGETLFLITTSSSNKLKWVLPKGRIEKHEAPQFAAIREVMEETGIQAKPIKNLGTVNYRRKTGRVVVAYFLMAFEKKHGTSTENRLVRWLPKEDAMELLQREEVKRLFRTMESKNFM